MLPVMYVTLYSVLLLNRKHLKYYRVFGVGPTVWYSEMAKSFRNWICFLFKVDEMGCTYYAR
jgi:hypothetical protein